MKLRYLTTLLTALTTVMSIAAAALLATAPSATRAQGEVALPRRLSDTGLYADRSVVQVGARVASFTPQYALWSDGADKRRWISLPPGASIDASDPDAWVFPPGTRLWKEFSHQGRKVETRYIERAPDGRWRFAAYVWNEDGRDAVLAPERGVAAMAVREAPGGRYDVPSRGDCLACHEGAAVPVLGVGALQLSRERDPLAPHASRPAPGETSICSAWWHAAGCATFRRRCCRRRRASPRPRPPNVPRSVTCTPTAATATTTTDPPRRYG